MRILVNGLSARLGGGQTYLLNLLRNVPQKDGWKLFLLSPDNLDLSGLPGNVVRIESHLKLDNPFRRAIWENLQLGKLAEKTEAEVLFSPGGLLPRSLPKRLKTAVTFQNMLPFDEKQQFRYPMGYRRLRDRLLARGLSDAMRKADLVIFISQFAKNVIESKMRLTGKNVVIPHGIDRRFFPNGKQTGSPIKDLDDYFLYVSFVDYYKNQIEVIRAYAKVREQSGTQATLLLVGAENPSYGVAVRQEIERLNLKEKVKLLGNLSHRDLPALYQNAKINLFASSTENCPNILLEMMASGRPALVSNRGPMPEFGRETVTYFDPEGSDELADGWLDLLKNPQLDRAALALNQVSKMDWQETAKRTWDAISEVVQK
jgi:glycosyltransferase involved in cell wall biosynthesis